MNNKKKNKLTQEMNAMEKVLQKQQDQIPNYKKQIAQAILDAQKMREESYYQKHGDPGEIFGKYKLDIEECLIATCKEQKLSPNLWALLNLAMHWYNDIRLWAEDVLTGKNILEECQKENAKMKDEMKQAGEGEIVDEDNVPSGGIPFGEAALAAEMREIKQREKENDNSK